MTFVNIFLVCSAEDLHNDGLEITDFISTLNDLYVERDLYFNLSVCEDEDSAAEEMGKQKQENHDIKDSQLFVIVFYKNAGQYAIDIFNEAYDLFKETGTPAILTFFRTDGSDPTTEVKAFMDRLDQELGHYFKTYSDIDAMKLYLLMQIKSMGLDTAIVFENGQAYIGNEPLNLSIDNLPELIKNTDWKKLKDNQKKIEEEFVEAQAEYFSDSNNQNTYQRFIDIANKRNNLNEQIEQLEKNIIDLTCKSVADSTKGNLTLRQRKAYQLLEQGKYHEADMILDKGEIFKDIDHVKNLKHSADEKLNLQLESYVDEILSKIDIKMTLVEDPDRFREIEDLYEEAVKLEADEDLNRKATRKYIKYLEDQTEYQRGIQLARQYLEYESQSDNLTDTLDGKESLAELLSLQESDVESLDEAESLYREILETQRKQENEGQEDQTILTRDIAISCGNLARLLDDRSSAESQAQAEALYREAIEIWRGLIAEGHQAYEADLATCCNNLAIFLNTRDDQESRLEAEALFREALEITLRLHSEDTSFDPGIVGIAFGNLASLLGGNHNIENQSESKELFRKALETTRKLANENPMAYEADLISICGNFACFLSRRSDADSQAEAESLFREAMGIARRMAKRNTAAFEHELALSCSNLAKFLSEHSYSEDSAEVLAECEKLNREAVDIYRRLAEEDPGRYEEQLALNCNNLANSLYNQNNTDCRAEAESLFIEALDIRRRLAAESPERYEADLAESCSGLWVVYLHNHNDDAQSLAYSEKLLREGLDIRRKLAADNPEVYDVYLADSCNNLAIFLQDCGDSDYQEETEALFREALVIRRRLASENPVVHDRNLAQACLFLALALGFHTDAESWEESMELHREALDIYRALDAENPGRYEDMVALNCYILAKNLEECCEEEDQEELEYLYREALDIYRRLVNKNQAAFESYLADVCNGLGDLLASGYDKEKLYEAEDLYYEAIDIRTRLASENPEMYEQDLFASWEGLETLQSRLSEDEDD